MPSDHAKMYNNRRAANNGKAEIGSFYHPSTVICAEIHYSYIFDKIVENLVVGIVFDKEVPKVNTRDALDVYWAAKDVSAETMINTITHHARWAKITYEELAAHVRTLYRAGKDIAD